MTKTAYAAPETTDVASPFHPLEVTKVEHDADAASLTFSVPPDLLSTFRYQAGQFVTLQVAVDDVTLLRCYSMSSAPHIDPDLTVTVKRVPGGPVSSHLCEQVRPGDVIPVSPPGGRFVLDDSDRHLVAFAAGSGITPIFSLIKTALATTTRSVTLLYANRDESSIIFRSQLHALAQRYPDRFSLVHHLDSQSGFVHAGNVSAVLPPPHAAECYLCGPPGFMQQVKGSLHVFGVPAAHVRCESFELPGPDAAEGAAPSGGRTAADNDEVDVEVELEGQRSHIKQRRSTSLLQGARAAGLMVPSSCEIGSCATCMGRVLAGSARMRMNNVLTPDEVAEGWVLTCQAVPETDRLRVVFE